MAEESGPSVSDVALRLTFARGERLYQIDRARSELIAARHREALRALPPRASRAPRKCERPQMKHILGSLARQCPVSTTRNCGAECNSNASCIRLEFHDFCRGIGRKTAPRKKAAKNVNGEVMDAILREHPPPAAGLLAGRLGSPESRGSGSAFPAFYTALLEPRNAEEETQK